MAADQIRGAIERLNDRATALVALMHQEAVRALEHASQHGDSTGITHLLERSAFSAWSGQLRAWFEAHGPLVWNGDGELRLIPRTNQRHRPFDLDGARANNPFSAALPSALPAHDIVAVSSSND